MRERMLTAHGEARSITEWARLKGLTKTILMRFLSPQAWVFNPGSRASTGIAFRIFSWEAFQSNPTAWRSAPAMSVRSQVKSGSLRPKCP